MEDSRIMAFREIIERIEDGCKQNLLEFVDNFIDSYDEWKENKESSVSSKLPPASPFL